MEVGTLLLRYGERSAVRTPTFAVEVADGTSSTAPLATHDCRPEGAQSETARDTDPAPRRRPRSRRLGGPGITDHLTPQEGAESTARSAGTRRLYLTHISDELDQVSAPRRAQRAFLEHIKVAREGAVSELRAGRAPTRAPSRLPLR